MRGAYVIVAAEAKQRWEVQQQREQQEQQPEQGLLRTQQRLDDEAAALARGGGTSLLEVRAASAEAEAISLRARLSVAVTAVAAALTRARTAEVNAGDAAASTELAEATLMAASARGSTLAQQLSVANSAVAAAAAAAVEQEATVAAHKRRADAASDAVTKLEVELGYIEVAAEGGSDRGCGSGWLRGGLADDHAHVTNTANAAPAASQSARLTFHSVPAAAMVARAQLSVARAQVLHLKEYATVWTASIDPPSTAAPVTRP
jgi:hypothetical protein